MEKVGFFPRSKENPKRTLDVFKQIKGKINLVNLITFNCWFVRLVRDLLSKKDPMSSFSLYVFVHIDMLKNFNWCDNNSCKIFIKKTYWERKFPKIKVRIHTIVS